MLFSLTWKEIPHFICPSVSCCNLHNKSINPTKYSFIHPSSHSSIHPSIHPICLSLYLSIHLPITHLSNFYLLSDYFVPAPYLEATYFMVRFIDYSLKPPEIESCPLLQLYDLGCYSIGASVFSSVGWEQQSNIYQRVVLKITRSIDPRPFPFVLEE